MDHLNAKRVFICSRHSGDIERNKEIALGLCKLAIDMGFAPFAPHLMYTQILDDSDPAERQLGISLGLRFMFTCDLVWVYRCDGVSEGMRQELDYARALKKTVMEMPGNMLCRRI